MMRRTLALLIAGSLLLGSTGAAAGEPVAFPLDHVRDGAGLLAGMR